MTQPLHDQAAVFIALTEACKAAGGQKAWGARYGISAQHVSDVLNTRRPLSPCILRALGYARVERYVKIRISNS